MNDPSLPQCTRYGSTGELPEHYGDPVLRVMLCSPHRLFAYWELPDDAAGTGSRVLLRLFESGRRDTEGTEGATEIEIAPGSCGGYIDVPFPGRAYTVELVKRRPDGSRRKLLRAHLTVPPAAPDRPSAFIRRRSLDASDAGNDGLSHPHVRRHGKKTPDAPECSPDSNPRLIGLSSWSLPGSSAP